MTLLTAQQLQAATGCTPERAARWLPPIERACGFAGWASFWRVIYVLPGHENDQRLLRYERKHLEQI